MAIATCDLTLEKNSLMTFDSVIVTLLPSFSRSLFTFSTSSSPLLFLVILFVRVKQEEFQEKWDDQVSRSEK